MAQLLPIAPPTASTVALTVDRVFVIELAVSVFVMLLVGGLLLGFSIVYRRRSPDDSPKRIGTHYGLETLWTGATFLLFTGFFFLGAGLYVHMKRPPLHAQRVYVVGKQWMWKIQHESDGIREINQLHVPVGEPTELVMTSEDVIHDFFVPAFRVKQDVIPGSYSSEWFTATVPGTYHLFCSQYCGTNHAAMVGDVIVLSQADYDHWRAGVGPVATPADAGRTLLASYGCMSCHGQTAPSFAGLYMSQVRLNDGTTVTADDQYPRRSIIDANAQIVAGFPPIMPSFRGQLTAEQVNTLVAYIKLLGSAKSISTTQPADDASLIHHLQNFPPAQNRPDLAPAPTKALN
jgi:cytochrome c oxidase subunit 2